MKKLGCSCKADQRFALGTAFAYVLKYDGRTESPAQRARLGRRRKLSGIPSFKETCVPVQALIDHIEGNSTLGDFLTGFPSNLFKS